MNSAVAYCWPELDIVMRNSKYIYASLIETDSISVLAQPQSVRHMSPIYSEVGKVGSAMSTADTENIRTVEEKQLYSTDRKKRKRVRGKYRNPKRQRTSPWNGGDELFDEPLFPNIVGRANFEKRPESLNRLKKRQWFESLYGKKGGENEEVGDLHVETSKRDKSLEICKYFVQGKCLKGSKCQYLHQPRDQATSVEQFLIPATEIGDSFSRISEPCRWLMESRFGVCRKNEAGNCKFDHNLSNYPCPFYFSTKSPCNGNCSFSHSEEKFKSEKCKLNFINIFKNFLLKNLKTADPWVKEYLQDYVDERNIIKRVQGF